MKLRMLVQLPAFCISMHRTFTCSVWKHRHVALATMIAEMVAMGLWKMWHRDMPVRCMPRDAQKVRLVFLNTNITKWVPFAWHYRSVHRLMMYWGVQKRRPDRWHCLIVRHASFRDTRHANWPKNCTCMSLWRSILPYMMIPTLCITQRCSLSTRIEAFRNAGGQNDEHRHDHVNHRVGLGVKRHIALHGMLMAYHHLVWNKFQTGDSNTWLLLFWYVFIEIDKNTQFWLN